VDNCDEKTHMYLLCFGIEGYEASLNIDELKSQEEQRVFDAIKGADYAESVGRTLRGLSMRFRMNSHRRIESYTCSMTESMYELITELLCENDETAKNVIREKGEKIRI